MSLSPTCRQMKQLNEISVNLDFVSNSYHYSIISSYNEACVTIANAVGNCVFGGALRSIRHVILLNCTNEIVILVNQSQGLGL